MDKGEDVMKYVDKRLMIGGFYIHIGVVDLFYRSGSTQGKMTYPIISLDFLKGDDRYGVALTIPFAAVTVGYVRRGKM